MAKMRVHELAKEFGMSSKEMLERLAEMKIPAKNHASTLEEAYVSKVRKELAPVLEARAEAIEAQRKAEEEAARAQEEAEKVAAEKERLEAEERARARREEERRRREEAEAKRKAEDEERRRREEAAAREAEKNRPKDTAPKLGKSYSSLLAQIRGEKARLEKEAQEKKEQRAAKSEKKRFDKSQQIRQDKGADDRRKPTQDGARNARDNQQAALETNYKQSKKKGLQFDASEASDKNASQSQGERLSAIR